MTLKPAKALQLTIILLVGAAWIALVAGCAGPGPIAGPLKFYEGPTQSDQKVAFLDWQTGGGRVLQIDDRSVDERARQVAVLPGRHTIQYAGRYNTAAGPPVRVGPLIARLELQAGHVYLVKTAPWGNSKSPYLFLWIQNAATGEVLHGDKPPP